MLIALALVSWLAPEATPAAAAYAASIERWRAEHEAQLKADDGWLVLAGLFWLKEGPNRFGAAPDNDFVLPASAPAHAGVFERSGRLTRVRLFEGVRGTIAGRPVSTANLRIGDGAKAKPDVLEIGALSMHVIQRGPRFAIRLRDQESATRRDFEGLEWFPADARYRVPARFLAYDTPKRIPIPNVLGDVNEMECPGVALFELDGREWRLEPVFEAKGATQLFFIFRDATATKETYGAGRFLYAELPKDGAVVLDFNKAENPPCAYTAFATCPLPPSQNVLPVRIEAGERFRARH